MAEEKPLIEQQRLGLWVAVNFMITLVTLSLALLALSRINKVVVVTQAEALSLDKRVDTLEKK